MNPLGRWWLRLLGVRWQTTGGVDGRGAWVTTRGTLPEVIPEYVMATYLGLTLFAVAVVIGAVLIWVVA